MRSITTVGAFVALAAMSLPAQRTQQEQLKVWEFLRVKYDTNNDNKVTAAEYGRGEASFASYDRTSDGVITDADFQVAGRGGRRGPRSMGPEQAAQTIAQGADKDGSRDVTTAEWEKALDSFGSANAVVTAAALAPLTQASGGRGRSAQVVEMMLRTLDANEDGTLTVGELNLVFARLDVDQNDTLQWNELGLRAVLPQKGDVAPDFELPHNGNPDKLTKLSSFAGSKPVALVFGSYT
jgi:Ca2+-binding EF-hand superfamily protein